MCPCAVQQQSVYFPSNAINGRLLHIGRTLRLLAMSARVLVSRVTSLSLCLHPWQKVSLLAPHLLQRIAHLTFFDYDAATAVYQLLHPEGFHCMVRTAVPLAILHDSKMSHRGAKWAVQGRGGSSQGLCSCRRHQLQARGTKARSTTEGGGGAGAHGLCFPEERKNVACTCRTESEFQEQWRREGEC